MALPTNLSTVTITGSYVDYSGDAITGQITFTLGDVLRSGIDNVMVVPSTVVVPLVNGSFTATLPATNDPDVIPNPYTYTVVESFVGGRTYTISVPYNGGAIDLADVSPAPTLATTYVQLIDETTFTTLETNITTLDTKIDQATQTIIASGKYWYIPSTYTTYTQVDSAFATYTALTASTYNLNNADISAFLSSAQASASSASSSLSTATNNASATIHPLLLIGG
jgi:hypothetical protein